MITRFAAAAVQRGDWTMREGRHAGGRAGGEGEGFFYLFKKGLQGTLHRTLVLLNVLNVI